MVMKKSLLAVGTAGLVTLVIFGAYWLPSHTSSVVLTPIPLSKTPVGQAVAQSLAVTPVSNGVAQVPGSVALASDNNATVQSSASGLQSTISPPVPTAEAKNLASIPALTRALESPQTLLIGDRKWTVLGTRDLPHGNGPNRQTTVLVLRDEASGQLDYRQSALRFVLQPGADYEGFIRERPNAQRVFVNPLYGDVSVDSAYIATEYAALSSDKRIVKVLFIPLVIPIKPR